MRVNESKQFSNIGAVTTSAFQLYGGEYAWVTKSTGAGTIDLNMLAADGSTWLAVATQITATTGFQTGLFLPPGQYQVAISGFTANYISITSVPLT